MSTRSERGRLARALIGFGAVLALALVAMLALTLHGPSAGGAQTQAATTALPARVLPPSELDLLRVDATIGDLESGRLLVAQLLDRYERGGDTDDLYEAVQWMDREWRAGYYQQSGLPTRVFERHCGNKVLRWHWLCDAGE
jgi:hypothetical protein